MVRATIPRVPEPLSGDCTCTPWSSRQRQPSSTHCGSSVLAWVSGSWTESGCCTRGSERSLCRTKRTPRKKRYKVIYFTRCWPCLRFYIGRPALATGLRYEDRFGLVHISSRASSRARRWEMQITCSASANSNLTALDGVVPGRNTCATCWRNGASSTISQACVLNAHGQYSLL